MWFEKTPRKSDWSSAIRHLRRDPVMRRLIGDVGPCTLARRREYFVVLCKSIFTQQISTRIATILFGRFSEMFPRKRPTPRGVIEIFNRDGDSAAKRCGLSRQKRAYILDLSHHFTKGQIPTRRFTSMTDDQIIESLTQVKGIGRWTAEMFLIFVLNRPDVWPVDDLGLREAVKVAFKLKDRPTAKELAQLAEPWRPYRTIATWYLWRSLGLKLAKQAAKSDKSKRRNAAKTAKDH